MNPFAIKRDIIDSVMTRIFTLLTVVGLLIQLGAGLRGEHLLRNHPEGREMIKYRSMPIQVLLMIVTLGIYSFYWFYSVASELKDSANDTSASPALWTVLLFVPFGAIYSFYKFGELYEKWSPDHFNRWLLFVLHFVFGPAVWFIVQSELNKAAKRGGVVQLSPA